LKVTINTIIERLNIDLVTEAFLRVLWLDENWKYVVVVNISDHRDMSYPFFIQYADLLEEIEEGKSRVIEMEPDLRLLSPDSEYLDKYREKRNARWDVIKNIVVHEPDIYMPDKRGKLIKDVYLSTGKSKKVIRDYLKKYWFYGKSLNGLLDNYFECGVPGEKRNYKVKPGPVSVNRYLVTEADKIIFASAIRVFHVRQGMSISTTHERMCETFYKRGFYRKYGVRVPIVDPNHSPTLRQFRYWYIKNSTIFSRYSNRRGKRRALIDVRPFQGNASEKAYCVGAVYEVDATRADVILVSFDRQTILGKPTLYIVIDVFSRMIVGYYVSLAPESWMEAMVAIEHAATNKVEYCAKYGIDISEEDWPCHSLPKNLVSDRGELKAQYTERFVNLEVDVLNAPSYRGDLKPFVESRFHITNETIRDLLPGSTEAQQRVRGDKDPSKEAALTIEEFNQFLIVFFLTYNKSALSKDYLPSKEMFMDKVELTPLKVWNWEKGRRLLHHKSKKELRYNLWPKETAKVTRFGLEFKGMHYTCDLGIKEGWFEGEGGIDGKKYVEIVFDPRHSGCIYYRSKKGDLIPCNLIPKYHEFEGLHFEEVAKIMEYRDEQIKQQEKAEKQHRAELHAFAEALNKTAVKETKDKTKDKSFHSRQQNKRDKRQEDSRDWGVRNAQTNAQPSALTGNADQSNVVVMFQNTTEELSKTDIYSQDIQALFTSKNNNRRRRPDVE